MGLSEELRDPWGLVASGISGGLAWALVGGPVGVALGAGVGAAVLGVKVITGLVVREPRRSRSPELARPPRGSYALRWLERAESAVLSLDDMAGTTGEGPTGLAVRSTADEAGDTLADLTRVAAQVTAVERALRQVESADLESELARLDDAAGRAPTAQMRAEMERSATAVRDRLQVRQRLSDARGTLLARMQATALGLEGLVARLAEVLALTDAAGGMDTSAGQIADLALELDGLRAGLAETEAVSRRALAQAPGELPGAAGG